MPDVPSSTVIDSSSFDVNSGLHFVAIFNVAVDPSIGVAPEDGYVFFGDGFQVSKKINDKKYRLFVGPFKNFNALKTTYFSLNNLGFEIPNIYID